MLLAQNVQDAAEAELRAAGVRLDAPTYSVTSVSGEVVEYSHQVDAKANVNTLLDADPEVQAANVKAWSEYQAGQRQLSVLRGERLANLFLGEGVDLSGDAEYADEAWARRQRAYGANVPDEEPARQIHYVQTVCLGAPDELTTFIATVTALSMTGRVDASRVEAAMALFRRRTAGNPAGATEDAQGTVDALGTAGGDADGAGVAPNA